MTYCIFQEHLLHSADKKRTINVVDWFSTIQIHNHVSVNITGSCFFNSSANTIHRSMSARHRRAPIPLPGLLLRRLCGEHFALPDAIVQYVRGNSQ
mgnify:CR=1 FL=1